MSVLARALNRHRKFVFFVVGVIFLLFNVILPTQAQSIAYATVQDFDSNNYLVTLNGNAQNLVDVSIYSQSLQCPEQWDQTVWIEDLIVDQFPYQIVLPKGSYIAMYNYVDIQQAVYFGLVDPNIDCGFITDINPLNNTYQSIPPLETISDWELQINPNLGLCRGDQTTLNIGDRVIPTRQFFYSGVYLRTSPFFSDNNIGRLNGDLRYALIVDGPFCVANEVNNVSWFKVLMNANNEPHSETTFLTGYMPLHNMSNTLLLQEVVHNQNHFPWEYTQSLREITRYGFPSVSVYTYPVGYTFLLPNQSYLNSGRQSGLNLRSGPCASTQSLGLINMHDGVFQILRTDLNGRWIEISFEDGRRGWVATRYVVTNLDNSFILEKLQPNVTSDCRI